MATKIELLQDSLVGSGLGGDNPRRVALAGEVVELTDELAQRAIDKGVGRKPESAAKRPAKSTDEG